MHARHGVISAKRNLKTLFDRQVQVYMAGNRVSLAVETTANALNSLHPNNWFKQTVCYLVSLLSYLVKNFHFVAAIPSTSKIRMQHLSSRHNWFNRSARRKCRIGVAQT